MGQGTILGIVPLLHFANHDMNDKKFYEMKKLHEMKKHVSLILALLMALGIKSNYA